jgi:hypothetical protein
MTDQLRRYECTGTLDHRDGTPPIPCECLITQEPDGTIALDCTSPPDAPIPVNWMKAIFGGPLNATLFKGHVKNGLPVDIESTLLGNFGSWNSDYGRTCSPVGLSKG